MSTAIDFLKSLPGPFIDLTAINPTTGKISGMSFSRGNGEDRNKCERWIAGATAKGYGIYFNVNGLRVRLGIDERDDKKIMKAKTADVITLNAFHVDADVSKNITDPAAFAAAKSELLRGIEGMNKPPTIVIDSGNGYGLFWMLRKPVKVTAQNLDQLTGINIALRDAVPGAADACQNLDRVMRVPYTTNFPNATKIKRGRVEVPTDLMTPDWQDFGKLYSVEDFESAPVESPPTAPADNEAMDVPDTVDLSRLAPDLLDLIRNGPKEGGRKIGDGSRSAVLFSIARRLVEAGFSDGEVVAVLADPDNKGPAAHIWRDGRTREPEAQAIKTLRDVKAKGAVARHSNTTAEEDFGDDPPDPLTEAEAEAAAEAEAENAEIKKAADQWRAVLDAHVLCLSPVAYINLDDKIALGSQQIDAAYNSLVNQLPIPARYKDHAAKLASGTPKGIKKVQGMCYRPGRPKICVDLVRRPDQPPRQDNLFNMWIDPCVKPLDGDPKIFLEHMRYLIPDERERKLLLDWLAWLVQHPDQKIMYAVLIVGLERTGKSWVGYMLRKLLGDSNVAMVGDEDPVGDTFNGWTENKLLGVVHELAPNPKVDLVARVKPIITEPTIQVNEKYIKRHRAENATHILAISNHMTSVKMLRNNPRWLVVAAADDPYGVDDDGEATPKFDAYYKRLWDAIGPMDDPTPTDEVRRIRGWLLRQDVSQFIRSIAPSTETRHEVADAGGTDIANQVNAAYRSRSAPFYPGRTLVTSAEVLECLTGQERMLRDNPLAVSNLVTGAMTGLGCRRVTKQVRIGGGDRACLWSVNRKLADKYKPMDDAAVAAIYKRERADAEAKAKAEAVKEAAEDFGS